MQNHGRDSEGQTGDGVLGSCCPNVYQKSWQRRIYSRRELDLRTKGVLSKNRAEAKDQRVSRAVDVKAVTALSSTLAWYFLPDTMQ